MNLKELRTHFVNTYGKFDLVVDRVNYVDNGANSILNLALEYLEAKYPQRRLASFKKDIVADTYRVDMAMLRAVESVYFEDASTGIRKLSPKTFHELQAGDFESLEDYQGSVEFYVPFFSNRLSPEQKTLETTDYTTVFTYGADSIIFSDEKQVEAYDSILLVPRPLDAGTITINGIFAETLLSDTDVCIWSSKYPLVVSAVAAAIHAGLSGAPNAMAGIDAVVGNMFRQIQKNHVLGEAVSFNRIGG